ncbi:MAG: hypothetical protein OEY41_00750 [Acidimicrobiia bacterium]|nr:hypothetical protein [Acidimicrobiia bacterium]MDH5288508.1 hypothetical protein [Acidimicrobiia bacterium]
MNTARAARSFDGSHPLDLQVVLGVTEAGESRLVGERHDLGRLVEHPLVQLHPEPGQPRFQLGTTAQREGAEEVEVHGPP